MGLKGVILLLDLLSYSFISIRAARVLHFFNNEVSVSATCTTDQIQLYYYSEQTIDISTYTFDFKGIDGCGLTKKSLTRLWGFVVQRGTCGLSKYGPMTVNVVIERGIDPPKHNKDNYYEYRLTCPDNHVSHEVKAKLTKITVTPDNGVKIQLLNDANKRITTFKYNEPVKIHVSSVNKGVGILPKNCHIHDVSIDRNMTVQIFENKCPLYRYIGNWQYVSGDTQSVESKLTGIFDVCTDHEFTIECNVDICEDSCPLPTHCTSATECPHWTIDKKNDTSAAYDGPHNRVIKTIVLLSKPFYVVL